MTTPLYADDSIITALTHDGDLIWESSFTTGVFDVQWNTALTSSWQNTWTSMKDIPAAVGSYNIIIPQYYRIAHREIPPSSSEYAGSFDAGQIAIAGTFQHTNIVPGTITINATATRVDLIFQLTDDGYGNLFHKGDPVGTVDYMSGAWSCRLGIYYPPIAGSLNAEYSYNEGE